MKNDSKEIMLDDQPDYVFVEILDKHGNIRRKDDFLLDIDLIEDSDDNRITIPIYLSKTEEIIIDKDKNMKVKYLDHSLKSKPHLNSHY